jgi:hypothetical protein
VLLVLAAACSQNVEGVNDPTRIEETPLPPQPGGNPLAIAPSATEVAGGAAMVGGEAESGMDDEVPPFVKAYFMHMWVEALYSTPQNNNPNPDWESPLTDPVNGRVWCTDCHVSGQVDFENIPKQRLPLTDVYENDHEFMADLMRKWVARLNSDEYFASAKLARPVDCLTCHATDPDPE